MLEKQLLDRMITDRVQLQFAKETGLRVDDAELDRAIQRIAEENKLTLAAAARKRSRSDGMPFAKFREDIRNEIIMARLREREVDNRIVVTDGEIDNFIKTQQAQASAQRRVQPLAHPGDRAGEREPGADPDPPRARRAGARRRCKGGTDFRQVAAVVFRRARRAAGRRHGLARREPAAGAVH